MGHFSSATRDKAVIQTRRGFIFHMKRFFHLKYQTFCHLQMQKKYFSVIWLKNSFQTMQEQKNFIHFQIAKILTFQSGKKFAILKRKNFSQKNQLESFINDLNSRSYFSKIGGKLVSLEQKTAKRYSNWPQWGVKQHFSGCGCRIVLSFEKFRFIDRLRL